MSIWSPRLLTSVAAVSALLLTSAAPAAYAAPRYSATAIGLSPGPLHNADAYALNDVGQVTGYGNNGSTNVGFVWQHGQLTTLGLLPGALTSAGAGINNAGVIAGASGRDAVVWQNDGQMQTLPRIAGASYAHAEAINDNGQVAGASDAHAVMWQDGQLFVLPSLSSESSSIALGINASGSIAGISYSGGYRPRALVWQDGQMQHLSSGPYSYAGALDISDNNTVAGYVDKGGNIDQAARWDDGQLTLLDDLPGTFGARAYGVNIGGLVVGASYMSGSSMATLWEGTQALPLQSLLIDASGWDLWRAVDINAAGQIIGSGTFNGEAVSFLLTPVPEASTTACMLMGLLALAATARRKARR